MAEPQAARDIREARLLRSNRGQAVRIPAGFEFSGTKVLIRKDGDRLIIEPVRRPDLLDTLRALAPLGPEDALPDDLDAPLLPSRPVEL